jgi:hypothetical protein
MSTGDANFYGNWLLAAAKADELLKEASKQDADFCASIRILETFQELNFAITATTFLSRLATKKEFCTFLVDVQAGELSDFALMAEMGFFALTGDRYQMTIPRHLDLALVKEAHLKLAQNDDHPEYFITDLPDFRQMPLSNAFAIWTKEIAFHSGNYFCGVSCIKN